MAIQAARGLKLPTTILPAEVTARELQLAEEHLFQGTGRDGVDATRGRPALEAPRAEVTEARAALKALLAASTEAGALDARGLERAVLELEHGAAKAARALFDEVRALKAKGTFVDVAKTTALSPELVARLDAGALTAGELKHVRRMAHVELLETFQDPVKDAAFRELVARSATKTHRLKDRDLDALDVPKERPLRETNARATLALRVMVQDAALPAELRLACVRRLGLVGDRVALPALHELATTSKDAALKKAAKTAKAQIEKAAKMTIVFASMEAKPYCGTGGLSNVMNELPKALAKMGHEVVVLVPRHEGLDTAKLEQTAKTGFVYGGGGAEGFGLWKQRDAGVDYWFIENERFFSKNRGGIYGDRQGDYADNAARYDFFGAAIPVAVRAILGAKAPDVVQLNDAHTASGAVYLKRDPAFAETKTVMAVHNLGGAYQGKFDKHHLDAMRWNGLGLFHPGGPGEFHDQINLLKLGLVESDGAITVSREYMKEVLTEDRGEGLHGVMRWLSVKDRLWGNLNGIDTVAWNPKTDPLLAAPFSIDDLAGKAACKADVQQRFGLARDPEAALVGVVARLTNQKGFDDILDTIERTMAEGRHVQFVVSGQGDQAIADHLRDLERRYPGKVAFDPNFTVDKEHVVYGGSDFFLMPSKFEPCGLPQMYALRYLTVPIVRAVGGLEESIQSWDEKSGTGNGFKFDDDLMGAMNRALGWYERGPEGRKPLLESCANSDFSWENSSAPEQLAFFRKLLFADAER